jgi:competence CoiA-like predicted nuclease
MNIEELIESMNKYSCPVCGKQYATLSGKKKHIRATHLETKSTRKDK